MFTINLQSCKIRISQSASVQNCNLSEVFSKNKEGYWKRRESEHYPRIVSGLGMFLPLMWDQAAAICVSHFPAEYHRRQASGSSPSCLWHWTENLTLTQGKFCQKWFNCCMHACAHTQSFLIKWVFSVWTFWLIPIMWRWLIGSTHPPLESGSHAVVHTQEKKLGQELKRTLHDL